MTRAEFDEDAGSWTVRTDRGVTFRARFLVTGLGLLSATNLPDLPAWKPFRAGWCTPVPGRRTWT